jgi:hypothetical protein
MAQKYAEANESYLALSIGNALWPPEARALLKFIRSWRHKQN